MGQTAASNLVPGQTYTLQFSISASGVLATLASAVLPNSLQGPAIDALIQSYVPFASGVLTYGGSSISGSTLTITFLANTGADVLTEGGIAAAIADMLNNYASGYTFAVLNLGPGLGTTTYEQQLAQTPTPTVLNSLLSLIGAGPAIPPPPTSSTSIPWWVYVALIGGGAYAVLKDKI